MPQVATPNSTYPAMAYDQVLDNMGGNTDLLRKLARLFLQQHAEDHGLIADALEKQDWPAARHLAHALRGTAATIGGMAVHDAAYQLEILLEDGDAVCQATMVDLQDTMSEFVAALERLSADTPRP